jgi:hypothetical protein
VRASVGANQGMPAYWFVIPAGNLRLLLTGSP